MSRSIVIVTLIALASVAGLGTAHAQRCNRTCDASLRDANGCCPAQAAVPIAEPSLKAVPRKATPAKRRPAATGDDWAECRRSHDCRRYCKRMGAAACASEAGYGEGAVRVALRESACDLGNGEACGALGLQLESGEGAPKDPDRATVLFLAGCAKEDWASCYYAGFNFRRGIGVERDLDRATMFLSSSCTQGVASGCVELGALVAATEPVRAHELYQRACTLENGSGCSHAAAQLDTGKLGAADRTQATALWVRACELEYAHGCWAAGNAYLDGLGVEVDHDRGYGLVRDACRLNSNGACYSLDRGAEQAQRDKADAVDTLRSFCDHATRNEAACGALARLEVHGGYSAEARPDVGRALLDASCDHGHVDACVDLGLVYLNGDGIVADVARAEAIFAKQCHDEERTGCPYLSAVYSKQGRHSDAVVVDQAGCAAASADSCNSLGFAHYLGRGTTWDVAKAAEYYQKSCDLGSVGGCANSAEVYEYGIGVPRDLSVARARFDQQCVDLKSAYACGRAGWFYQEGSGGVTIDLAIAEARYRASCGRDSEPLGCGRLAMLLRKQDDDAAAELAMRAFREAQKYAEDAPYYKFVLGMFYRDGVGVAPDRDKAGELFSASCDGFDAIGCIAAAEHYLGQGGAKVDFDRAAGHAERACVAKVERGCELRGMARKRLPLSGGRACGCGAGGAETGVALALVVVAGLAPRRRRRRLITTASARRA